jgi:predicted O-linked N-acetylglucosamine transferase (SPINDLY family)
MLSGLLKRIFREQQRDGGGWLERSAALQQRGRYEDAAAVCRARLTEAPDDPEALQGLAAALLGLGRAHEGLSHLRRATVAAPGEARPLVTLGRVSAALGELDAAIYSYRRALALQPNLHDAAEELIVLLKATERYDEAEEHCRHAIASGSDSARSRHALAGVLFEQGRVEEAIGELQASLAIEANAPAVHSDLLRALNYREPYDPQAVFEAHQAWGRRHAEPLGSNAAAHEGDLDPDRRLRVGYVSPYFRKHAVTFFFESVVEHHDRESFELVLYADVPRPDAYSERLKAYGARWRSSVGMSDAALAQMVREDRIDVLVDLSGHTPRHRLLAFARGPAPVQVTWNGYPNTTGMREIGYRITDAGCDPAGKTERLHTEELVRLPGVYMSWRPPPDAPDPGLPPAKASHRITFGSFNAAYKVTPSMVAVWSRILGELPESRLVLFAIPPGRAENRLRTLFHAQGITEDRIEFRARMSHEAFLLAHREVDIALDTFPYHGTTTTCFSLWMGVPVISLVGSTHVSRVGLTILSSIGLPDLAAQTAEQYVHTAVALARKPEELRALRNGMRERMLASPLTDGRACAKALEEAYRGMWQRWCAGSRHR